MTQNYYTGFKLGAYLLALSPFILSITATAASNPKWSVTCTKKVCEMYSEIRGKDKKIQARAFIQYGTEVDKKSKKSKKTDPFLIAMLPLGIHIPAGITVAIDDKNKFRAILLDCTVKEGCRAGFDLKGEIKNKIEKAKKLTFNVVDGRNKRKISFHFSLNKFSGVFKEFEKKVASM